MNSAPCYDGCAASLRKHPNNPHHPQFGRGGQTLSVSLNREGPQVKRGQPAPPAIDGGNGNSRSKANRANSGFGWYFAPHASVPFVGPMPPTCRASMRRIQIIDSHTGGEPTRCCDFRLSRPRNRHAGRAP